MFTRILVAVLIIIFLAFILGGCGGGNDSEDPQAGLKEACSKIQGPTLPSSPCYQFNVQH